jgi:hypothetical protein
VVDKKRLEGNALRFVHDVEQTASRAEQLLMSEALYAGNVLIEEVAVLLFYCDVQLYAALLCSSATPHSAVLCTDCKAIVQRFGSDCECGDFAVNCAAIVQRSNCAAIA